MSRWDLTGLFWDDYVEPTVAKVKEKREPPEPIWLADDYLPGLEQAKAHTFDLMTDAELINAAKQKTRLIWDTEFYGNYSLVGGKNEDTNKLFMFEIDGVDARLADPDIAKLSWILRNFTMVGFNDTAFDVPMAIAALGGFTTKKLMGCVNDLIFGRMGERSYGGGMRPYQFYKAHKLSPLVVDNIDLIDLTPLGPSLKICMGRIAAPRMADLPFPPGRELSEDQKTILRYYWTNDLDGTALLAQTHQVAMKLREQLTSDYGVDVRSKSDPQIAEQVIRKEITRISKQKYFKRAEIEPGRQFKFTPAAYVKYQTPDLQWLLNFIREQIFTIDEQGSPTMPEALSNMDVPIGGNLYRMGIGGLHSKEKKMTHFADDDCEISDNDVTSYYPALILQQGMFPPNVGPVFLQVFKRIVDRRIAAKRAGDKPTAETLKIVVNGTFGKTGERGGYSIVYYPEMMIQVTLSGQLALLMLIEALEINGIAVISANTDGIMVKCPKHLIPLKEQIMRDWQDRTELELESVAYKAVYSRDVNNYIAIYDKPSEKETGAFKYAKAIGTYRKTVDAYPPKWNPTCEICSEALILHLATGSSVDETIRGCTDMRKFIEVRRVTGGAFKDGEYLGKAIRWYYSKESGGPIINAKNGNFVPRSQGAKPCLRLPSAIPEDLDFDYYIERAYKMLEDLLPKEKEEKEQTASD